jgi:1-carboxybiuret hydrolase
MQGRDVDDSAQASQQAGPVVPLLHQGATGLRVGVAGDYFRRGGRPECFAAVDEVAAALNATREIVLPEAAAARAAAFVITAAEGAAFHLSRLRERPQDFDAAVRDRLFAGAIIPAAAVLRAQKLRAWFYAHVNALFENVDLILAPATPCRAPLSGQKTLEIDGTEVPVRANLGIYTQPISFIGLPAMTVPLWTAGERLPIGVQIIGAPWREDLVLRTAYELEKKGIACAPVA